MPDQVQEFQFSQTFTTADSGRMFRLPFEVEADAERIDVDFETPRLPNLREGDAAWRMVSIGIADPRMIRGWNTVHESRFILAEEFGSPGAVPGPLQAGTWHVLMFPYVPETVSGGVTARVTVRVSVRRRRFVKGDTHTHTVHSDGTISAGRVVELAAAAGLDYVFLTDHNISSANYSLPRDSGILAAPGIEYGHRPGHMNILGETTSVPRFLWDPESVCYETILSSVKGGAAGAGMNHPFCTNSPWTLDKGMDFDWVEIWNGFWRPVNAKALRWWQGELLKGRRLPVIGGSDTHHENDPLIRHGFPCTHALVDGIRTSSLVEAFKAGHCYITQNPEGPRLSFSSEHAVLGDLTEDRDVRIVLEGLRNGDVVGLVDDLKTTEQTVDGERFEMDFRREKESFLRVEVTRKIQASELVPGLDFEVWSKVLISNPMYFRHERSLWK